MTKMEEIWNKFHKLKESHKCYLLEQLNKYWSAKKEAHLAQVDLDNKKNAKARKDREFETSKKWVDYAYD